MEKFISKYSGKVIENWGILCSTEFKAFAVDFKRAMHREFPRARLHGFKANHYDFSGFVEENGRFVYVYYAMPRDLPFDSYCRNGCFNGILVRTAKNEKDYCGGDNQFCDFWGLHIMVESLLEKGD